MQLKVEKSEMKKYRPVKLWILMPVLILASIFVCFLCIEMEKQIGAILLLVCIAVESVVYIWSFSCYLQFENDKIVTKLGLTSKNLAYCTTFVAKRIKFSDIAFLDIDDWNQYVVISLKDGTKILFVYKLFSNTQEITDELYTIKEKISQEN